MCVILVIFIAVLTWIWIATLLALLFSPFEILGKYDLFDLWPLTGRSDAEVTVDNFACLAIPDMLALLILSFEIVGIFDLFWPLTPYRKVGQWGHRGQFCMSSHTWYVGTANFAIWNTWKIYPFLTFDPLPEGRVMGSPWTLLHV